ncbi:hypothetical protein D9M68_935680 [compost metagenome]
MRNWFAVGFICLIAWPQAVGNSSGTTKYQRNSCTSSGVLRKQWMYTADSVRAVRWGSVRATPAIRPRPNASVQASSDSATVHSNPRTSIRPYRPSPVTEGLKKINQSQV